jgi:MFS family permease
MLVGGALSDRFPPRNIMFASNLARFILVSLLAGLVFTNRVEMWMIYTLAILFGIADAFLYPAHSAMMPQLVQKNLSQTADSLLQGMYMLTMLAGPVLAGLLITALGDGSAAAANSSTPSAGQGIAAALAGVLPQPNPKHRGAVLLALAGGMGIGLALLGFSSSTNFAAVIGLVVGAFNGCILVFLVTRVQSRPPEEFVGRLMSLLLFASTGLIPVSMALSGVVSRVDVTGLLIVSGALIMLISLAMLFNPTVRAMEPAPTQAAD